MVTQRKGYPLRCFDVVTPIGTKRTPSSFASFLSFDGRAFEILACLGRGVRGMGKMRGGEWLSGRIHRLAY